MKARPQTQNGCYTPNMCASRSGPLVGPPSGAGACLCAICRTVYYNFPVMMLAASPIAHSIRAVMLDGACIGWASAAPWTAPCCCWRRVLLPSHRLKGAHLLSVLGHQGLNWYQRRLKQDADGDVADAFFREHPPQPSRAAPPETGSAPGHHAAPLQPPLQVAHALSSPRPEHLFTARLLMKTVHGPCSTTHCRQRQML